VAYDNRFPGLKPGNKCTGNILFVKNDQGIDNTLEAAKIASMLQIIQPD
jgi:hypothetical protein